MYTARPILFSLIFMLVVVLGCSGGGNPVTPEKPSGSFDSTPIIGLTETGDDFNALGVLGAFELTINPEKLTAELVSKRATTIGESYIVSGINFFTMLPCKDCLKITGFNLDMGNIALKYSIEHPFPQGNMSLPPTASNRRDLNVFDLAMVIKPAATTPTNYPLMGASIYSDVVANANGYTKELANVISDTAALPFVLVVDDSEGTSSTYNEFAMGAIKEFEVAFKLTGTLLRFDMYLTMGYGASAKKPDRLTPKYYNPEFNRKAAWKVEAAAQGEWVDNDDTTPVDVEVKVYDWQIGATVYATPADFANAPANNVYAASEVASVSVEIPGMNDTLPSVTTADSGTGTPSDPLIFNVPVENDNLLPIGEYAGIVKVLDSRPVLTVADGRDIIIDTPDGMALNYFAMPEYATYQTFDATVIQGCTGLCWAKRAGGIDEDFSEAVAALSDDSTVISGSFLGSATFGEGESNETTLISAGIEDIFIARYNSNGSLAWAKRAGGTGYDVGTAITVLSDDSFVITGFFYDSIIFQQGLPGQVTLYSDGLSDIFIARYNSEGSLVWAKRAGGTQDEHGLAITVLSGDSFAITGDFFGTATFGESEANETVLTAAGTFGYSDLFVAKYNPNGTVVWAKVSGGTQNEIANGITSLSDGSVVLTGSFKSASAIFGWGDPNQTTLITAGDADIFIARFNSNGVLVWAKRVGGGLLPDVGNAIVALSDDTTIVTGFFAGINITFGPGDPNAENLSAAGNLDIFIVRYNSNGTINWAERKGGSGQEQGLGLVSLSDDTFVITGYFNGFAYFGDPLMPDNLTSYGQGDVFIARYDSDSSYFWAKQAGGIVNDGGDKVAALSDDSVVVTGYFSGAADFGKSEPNATTLNADGSYDIFIARYKY